MAQTTIRFDNEDLKEVRKFAKDNGLMIKRAIIVAMRVGLEDEMKFMEAYRSYGRK